MFNILKRFKDLVDPNTEDDRKRRLAQGKSAQFIRGEPARTPPPQTRPQPRQRNFASRVFDQANLFDSGRSFGQSQALKPQSIATNLNSIGRGVATMGVEGIAKPLIRSSINLNDVIGDTLERAAGRTPMTNEQVFGSIPKKVGYTGSARQVAGDLATNVLNVGVPGASKAIPGVASRVLPKAVPRIVPKVIGGATAGAIEGGPSQVANLVATEQPLSRENITRALGQGTAYGAAFGGAIPAAGAGARASVQVAKVAPTVARNLDQVAFTPRSIPRIPAEEIRNLTDYADTRFGLNKAPAAELNIVIPQARAAAAKLGIDITSGSPNEITKRISDAADAYYARQRGTAQGGYVGIPKLNKPIVSDLAEDAAFRRTLEIPNDVPATRQPIPLVPKLPRVQDLEASGANLRTKEITQQNPLPIYNTKRASTLDKAFRSTRSIIERQGEEGKQLGGMLQKTRDVEEIYQANTFKQLPTVTKLKGKDYENFVDATQGLAKPKNPKVAQAVTEWQTVHPAIRDRAVQAGLDVGDIGPTYYPHIIDYDKIFKDKNKYNQSINHLVKTGQAGSPEEAIQLLGYARDVSRNRKFGNLEASRILDLPFYDKTPNSLTSYIQGSSRRIAQTETFGKADENALALIAEAGKKGFDTEAMKNAYDVAVGAKQYNPNTAKFAGNVRKYLSTTRLGLGAITNSSQSVNTGIVTGHLRTMGAMMKQLDPKTRAFVENTGTVADSVINDIRESTGFTGKVLSKITAPGFSKVEKFNRSVAATAGRDYANKLARKGDTATLKKLGVTGKIGKELTEAQQIQAARKIVEKTQFKVDPQDLPGWASSPAGKLVSQFRTFSYNQGKFFSNEILKPAAKGNLLPLTRLLAALPIGYALYDTKRRIAGRPEEENKARRGVEAFSSVGGAGLAADIFRSLVPLNNKTLTPERRVSMAVGAFGGPAAGSAAEAVGAVSNAAPKALGGTSDSTQLKRLSIRQVPIVGTAVQNRVLPYKNKTATGTATGGDTAKTDDRIKAAFTSPEGKEFIALKNDTERKEFARQNSSNRKLYDQYKAMKTAFGGGQDLLPADISESSATVLNKFDRLTPKAREKKLYSDKTAEFAYETAKYERDKLDGKLTRKEVIDRESKLDKLQVGSKFDKDVRDLYGLSKTKVYDLITSDKEGKKLANELLAYGDALEGAGLANNKFRDSKGNVKFNTAKSGKGKKGKKFTLPKNYINYGSNLASFTNILKKARVSTKRSKA